MLKKILICFLLDCAIKRKAFCFKIATNTFNLQLIVIEIVLVGFLSTETPKTQKIEGLS